MSHPWLQLAVHPSWEEFLTDARRSQIVDIAAQVGEPHNPAPERVLRFLQTDLDRLQVVLLGQDPYPQPGVATGRAFEVGGLHSWQAPFPQTSLRNLLRLLYRTDRGIADYADIPRFTAIRSMIAKGEWHILPPDRLFAHWEQQGVLLLNTCLTVDDQPLQHQALWQEFTEQLLQYISLRRTDLCWFLWGKSAQQLLPWIEYGVIYPSRHPMLCSPKFDDDFLKAECFQETWHQIDWLGKDSAWKGETSDDQ